MPNNRRKVYPVPELVVDDAIRIEGVKDGSGSMDNESRLMRVPLLDTPSCRHVRAHEMAHAKYSPKRPICPHGVHRITIQRVEDMRMNVLCRGAGLHDAMDAPIVNGSAIWDRLLTGEREALTAGISTYDTGDWSEFVERTEPSPAVVEFIESVHAALCDDPSWRNTQRQAQAVEAFLNPPEPEPSPDDGEPDENSSDTADDSKPGDPEPGEPSDGDDSDDDAPAEPSDDDSDDDSEPSDDDDSESSDSDSDGSDGESDGEPDDSGESGDPGDSDDDGEPEGEPVDLSDDVMDKMIDATLEADAKRADMTPFERGMEILERLRAVTRDNPRCYVIDAKVTEQRMTKRLAPNKFKSRAKVPADTGMRPQYMNRYCTDKAIFAGRGRKRSQGGTILVDASGSMRIYDTHVDAMMEAAPLGTIATYSGDSHGGDIYVIAKNGKRAVDNLTPYGGMNKVDVAALEWMVKQEPPYFWVCDGHLTGANSKGGSGSETMGRHIYDRCMEIVEKHGIVMVPNIDKLPDVMRETLTGKRPRR